jgi:dihydroorotase
LRGAPVESEASIVARDIQLAEETRAHLHVAHLSTAAALEHVREGKKRGVHVTCEVTPHHLLFTDEEVGDYDTNCKMNPPLRAKEDVEAILEGIADGTLSILCSDHAPHAEFEKEVEFDQAPFGIVGLETELGLFIHLLVHKHRTIEIRRLIEMYTVEPAKLLKLNAGTLSAGAPADVTLIDPDLEWPVQIDQFQSMSRNSPFHDWKLKGRAVRTIVGGKTVWKL